MGRIKGLVDCSVNFEVKKTAPLDSRIVVDTVLELTETTTWVGSDGLAWLYDGLVVAVKENNGLYMLKGFGEDPVAYSDLDNWIRIDASVEIINSLDSSDTDKALAAAQGKILNDKIEDIKSSISSVYNYKGSKDTYAELPTDAQTGDVWNVVQANGNIPAGTNYAWDGNAWDPLGGSVDLTGYYTKELTDAAISEAINGIDISDLLTELESKVNANTSALLVVNGSADTTGSIANTLKIAKDYTDSLLTNYVEKEQGKSLISDTKLTLIDTNASNIAALEVSVEANTASLNILNGNETTEGSVLNIVNTQITNALEWQKIE